VADVGLTSSLERRQYAWTPENGVPEASTRIGFRQGSDDEFVELFREAARGSLDVETRQALETVDELSQARDDVEFYESCPGERDWWRVATDRDGTPVGFIVPSATPYHRNVGYLGVLPRHRGQGLVDALLGEVTRIRAAAGADRITATTDMTNVPMAAAFDRAAYQVTEIRLVLEAPPSGAQKSSAS
jgi:ribosomal protein S18 acetylase RimI-like enzyme